MKVLHVGSGNLYGGVEKVLLTLARQRHLCPEMEQHFAVCFRGRLSEELQNEGVPLYWLKKMHGRDPLAIVSNRCKLSLLQRKLNLDAVIYHSLWSYDLLAVGTRRGAAARILWLHDAVDKIGPLEFVARWQQPEIALSNSRFTAGTVLMLYPKIRVSVVYCPVEFTSASQDIAKRKAIRQSLRTGPEDVVIVQLSRMEAWKGHSLHLRALSRLHNLPGWVLWIGGDAQRPEEQIYLDSLKQQAMDLGIAARIRFLGHRTDVAELLLAADIHCQPNLGPEPFGITYVEAMMAGLPVVACRLGAASELIDASCGLLCEPEDVSGLAFALRLLITGRDLRERLGRSGPERAKQLSDPAARLNDLYAALRESIQADKKTMAYSTLSV